MPRFKNLVTRQSKDDEVVQEDIDDENTQETDDAPTVIDLLDMGLSPNRQETSNPTNVDITDMLIT